MPSTYKSPEARARLADWFHRFRDRIGFETESREVHTTAGRTHVLVGGPEEGDPLVALHGQLASSAHAMAELAPLFERFRVYAVDIVGQSPMSHDELLPVHDDAYGTWLVEVMDELGIASAHVVGVSFGGFVALRLAVVAPDRIRRLALLVPAGVVGSHWSGWVRIGLPLTAWLLCPSEARLRRALAPMMSTPDEAWVAYMGDAFRSVELTRMRIPSLVQAGELQGLAAPTLVLAGDEDLSFPGPAVIERLQSVLPSLADSELLPGCRHLPPTTDAFRQRLSGRITRFLSSGGQSIP